MAETEGLRYPFSQGLEKGEMMEVAPGVLWVRLPMPFRLDHINVWLLEDGEGWALVDTGPSTRETREAWEDIFEVLGRPLTRVIVTHMHMDHAGLGGWLSERFGVALHMSLPDYFIVRLLTERSGGVSEQQLDYYRGAGLSEEYIEQYKKISVRFRVNFSPLPSSYQRLCGGDLLSIGKHEWRVMMGYGHAPEHACLFCAELGLFISGDQVLPRLSSNVSVLPLEPEANPLALWWDTRERFERDVPPDTLILPAHHDPFFGLHLRLAHFARKHERRLGVLREVCVRPQRVVDLFPSLFATSVDLTNFINATGEAMACLNYLRARGEMRVEIEEDGVRHYVMGSS